MNKYTLKMLGRSIKGSIGRYLAIFAIVALGIGFFTGINNAEPSMQKTLDDYFDRLDMYDFSLVSTLGFTDDDVNSFLDIEGITNAEGVYKLDLLMELDEIKAYQVISLGDLAKVDLVSGKMPQNDGECVVDANAFSESDIGKTISVTDETDKLKKKSFKIVGLVKSPRFISYERGSTTIGDGNIAGFIYVLKDTFNSDVYHEIILNANKDLVIFSDEYNDEIDSLKSEVESLVATRANLRFNDIKNEALEKINEEQANLDKAKEDYNNAINSHIPAEMLIDSKKKIDEAQALIDSNRKEIDNLEEPDTYTLTLEENVGASRFKNDISIVSSIAKVFPVFFILVVIFVCATTMNRMVNDERTQIGTLKALGYSANKIASKYILYVVTAAFLGCICGFFLGTGVIPRVIWQVYDITYGFSDLSYYFSPISYILCLVVAILGSGLITLFSCYHELREKPAYLIRPKAPSNGKRIFLEYINWFWMRLSFLSKVTIRNTFRYKKRMFMMLLGIGGCTALLVTGFGVKDSIADILDYQFEDIMKYDATVSFEDKNNVTSNIDSLLSSNNVNYILGYQTDLAIDYHDTQKEATVIAISDSDSKDYFGLHNNDKKINYPKDNQVVVSSKLAEVLNIKVNDKLPLTILDKDYTFIVSGICDNYLNHYIYINKDYLSNYINNHAYLNFNDIDDHNKLVTNLRNIDGVNNVSLLDDDKNMLDESMNSLNYIVALLIVSAGALAFIVLYNLTNINIIERNREIATVKVLGFHSNETASYVLRENIILSIIGALFGLFLGKLLHLYVMAQIQVEQMAFEVKISSLSYVLSLIITILFAFIANFIMRFKLEKINMAESMKSVE